MFGILDRRERPDELLIITGAVVESFSVQRLTADSVEAGEMVLPRAGLAELIRPTGQRVFVAQADLPARVEAEEIRRLRHNAIMSSLFGDADAAAKATPWQMWAMVFALIGLLGWAAIR